MTRWQKEQDITHRENSRLMWRNAYGLESLFIAIYRQEFQWLKEMNT